MGFATAEILEDMRKRWIEAQATIAAQEQRIEDLEGALESSNNSARRRGEHIGRLRQGLHRAINKIYCTERCVGDCSGCQLVRELEAIEAESTADAALAPQSQQGTEREAKDGAAEGKGK